MGGGRSVLRPWGRGLLPSSLLHDVEFDSLVLVERAVAIGVDCEVVNEHVRSAAWLNCLGFEVAASAADLLTLVPGPFIANDEDGHDDDENGYNDEDRHGG